MIKLQVTGMTCPKCVAHVTKALQGVSGVASAQVSLEKGEAVVEGTPELGALIAAVVEEGYEAQEARP
jgi:copper chaperone